MTLPSAKFKKVYWKYAWVRLIDPLLVEAIVMAESSGDPKAVREEPRIHDRSRGLMQILERTARGLGYPEGKPFDDLYDPETNVQYGVKLLCELFDGVTKRPKVRMEGAYRDLSVPFPQDVRIALARYNGGFSGNPAKDGSIRNSAYVSRIEKWFTKVKDSGDTSAQGELTPPPASG